MGAGIATIVIQLQYSTSHEFDSTVETESWISKKRMPMFFLSFSFVKCDGCDEMMSHTHASFGRRTHVRFLIFDFCKVFPQNYEHYF